MSEVLTLSDNPMSIMAKMSEGNPGAFSVLAQMSSHEKFFPACLRLDSKDIRGSKIWLGYKDYCGQDLEAFISECMGDIDAMSDFVEAVSRGEYPQRKES